MVASFPCSQETAGPVLTHRNLKFSPRKKFLYYYKMSKKLYSTKTFQGITCILVMIEATARLFLVNMIPVDQRNYGIDI